MVVGGGGVLKETKITLLHIHCIYVLIHSSIAKSSASPGDCDGGGGDVGASEPEEAEEAGKTKERGEGREDRVSGPEEEDAEEEEEEVEDHPGRWRRWAGG